MWCDKCHKWFQNPSEMHTFSGYGFFVKYCPGCCPGSCDGTDCDEDHPEGWKSEAAKAKE